MTDDVKTDDQTPETAPKAPAKKGGFNPDAPYGTVHGGDTNAVYCQNGKYFDGQGKPVKGL